MKLPEWSNELVPVEYYPTRIPEYADNPFIRALRPILSRDDAKKKLVRKWAYKPECRKWEPHERAHLAANLDNLVAVLSANLRFEQMVNIMMCQGYRGRYGIDFWRKVHAVDEISDEMMQVAAAGTIAGTALCGMVVGISGLGKTTMLATTMETYRDGIYCHKSFEGKPLNQIQVPFLTAECPHDASVGAMVELLLHKLGRLVNENLFIGLKQRSAARMIPVLVKALLKYSVGMVVIDEAQVLASRFSGGDTTLLYFWISMMNQAGVPMLLLANPEILKITGRFLKAGMRFCSGGEMHLHELPRHGEWQVLLQSAWPYQYTAVETELTEELSDEFYHYSCGIPRATLMLYRFAQLEAINENKGEVITSELVERAAWKNMDALQPMLDALRKNTLESRTELAFDLGEPSPIKRPGASHNTTTPVASQSTPVAAERVSSDPGAMPAAKAKPAPKRGKKPALVLPDYLEKEVVGEYNLVAAMIQDGLIKYSTELMT